MRRRAGLAGLVVFLIWAPALAQDQAAQGESVAETPQAEQALGVQRLISELRERTRQLEKREFEVAARENAVADLEREAERLLDDVEALRGAVERRIAEIESSSGDRISRLAKVYGAMSATRAAPLLEGLDLRLATQILSKMKHKQSAQVLAVMPEEVALRLSRSAARPLDLAAGPASSRGARP